MISAGGGNPFEDPKNNLYQGTGKLKSEKVTTPQLVFNQSYSQEESLFLQLFFVFRNTKPRIPESQLYFMAYLYLYPLEYKRKLIEDGRFQSNSAISNSQSILKDIGLVKTTGEKGRTDTGRPSDKYALHPQVEQVLKTGDIDCLIKIKIV